jgi:hypothetical protein
MEHTRAELEELRAKRQRLFMDAARGKAGAAEELAHVEAQLSDLSGLGLRNTFVEAEYNALRQEITDCEDRNFKLIAGGLLIVPTAEYLAKTQHIGIIRLLLPLIIIAFFILFFAQLQAIKRCGVYIRLYIERDVPGVTGWENWLSGPAPRGYETLLNVSVYLISALFYVIALLIAATVNLSGDPVLEYLDKLPPSVLTHPETWPRAAIGMYTCLGIAVAAASALVYLHSEAMYTKTKQEAERHPPSRAPLHSAHNGDQ